MTFELLQKTQSFLIEVAVFYPSVILFSKKRKCRFLENEADVPCCCCSNYLETLSVGELGQLFETATT